MNRGHLGDECWVCNPAHGKGKGGFGVSKLPKAPRVTIEVTGEVIAHSTERDSSHCMIAEAVRHSIPDADRVSVDLQTIRFSDPKKGLRYTYLTPRVGQVALIDFDQGQKPEPFTMRLSGGQVTAMDRKPRELSDETRAKLRAAGAKGRQTLALRKTKLRTNGDMGVPDRVGGRTPPTTPFARRRAFGIRALAR